jgi:anti-sigma factor RsiW
MSDDMADEEIEFAISQYADGTLPEDQRGEIEARLVNDIEARRLLEQYRRIDAALRHTSPAIPDLNWNTLAEHLSATIDREERDRLLIPLGDAPWHRRMRLVPLAAAAALVLSSALALLIYNQSTRTSQTVQPGGSGVQVSAVVEGPKPESSTGPSETIVHIGPAPAADIDVRLAENIVSRPSRVVWIASGDDRVQDREPALY